MSLTVGTTTAPPPNWGTGASAGTQVNVQPVAAVAAIEATDDPPDRATPQLPSTDLSAESSAAVSLFDVITEATANPSLADQQAAAAQHATDEDGGETEELVSLPAPRTRAELVVQAAYASVARATVTRQSVFAVLKQA